jgi:cation:H+ antiporter
LTFASLPFPLALALFAFASLVVWLGGARLSRDAVELSDRTGLGKAFVGMLLLGGITSLPELVTTVTAALDQEIHLAVNNLLGGVSLQVALLAVVDAAIGASAFSAIVAHPSVMLMGVLDVLLLAVVLAVVLLGEVVVAGVGVGAASIFVLALVAMWIVNREHGRAGWLPQSQARRDRPPAGRGPGAPAHAPLSRLIARISVAGIVILVGGFLATRSAEVIADRTPLGASFVGVALLALSTSLPELSTTLAAARLRQYEMAFADIFGTNLFDLGLIFVADVVYRPGPALAEAGRFAALAAVLGIALTSIYLFGLIERRDRVILRMGYDSLVVLIVYAAGLYALFRIR